MNLFQSMSLCGTLVFAAVFLAEKISKNKLTGKTKYTLYKVALLFYLLPVQWFKFQYKRIFMLFWEIRPNPPLYDNSDYRGMLSVSLGDHLYIMICPWKIIVFCVSLLLTVVFFSLQLKKYFKAKHILLKRSCKMNRKMDPVLGSCPCYISSAVSSPFSMGVLRPRIILPDACFTDEEQQLIYVHEMNHIRQGDILLKFVSLFAVALHWYNPFIYVLYQKLQLFCEYACDEAVLQSPFVKKARTYYILLIKMSVDQGIYSGLFVQLSANQTKLKQRIENMKNSTRNAKSVKAAITLLTVGAVFISSTISTCAYHPLNDHTFAFDSEESAEHFLNVPKAQESSPGKANTLSMHRRYFKIPFGNQSDLYKYVHKKNSKGGCTIYKFIVPVCTGCEYHKPYIFDSSVIYARCPH